MNAITRMMKRYIKTPLKYALPLLFIGSLALVSISGCTSSTTPTATPTTNAATSTLGLTPLLKKIEPTLKQQYGSGISSGVSEGNNVVSVKWTTKDGWSATAAIDDRGTVDAASTAFNTLKTPDSTQKSDPGNETGFGRAAATAALGHTPTVKNDAYLTGTGNWAGINNEYLQYDQIFIQIEYTAPS
jgi:hypothetical protein